MSHFPKKNANLYQSSHAHSTRRSISTSFSRARETCHCALRMSCFSDTVATEYLIPPLHRSQANLWCESRRLVRPPSLTQRPTVNRKSINQNEKGDRNAKSRGRNSTHNSIVVVVVADFYAAAPGLSFAGVGRRLWRKRHSTAACGILDVELATGRVGGLRLATRGV